MPDSRAATRARRWMLLGPVAFVVHDAEEILVFAPWLRRHGHELPTVVRPLFAAMGTREFALAVGVLLLGYVAAAALGTRMLRHGRRPWPYLVVTGAFVANGVTHVLQSIALRGYTPGVITALAVSLPYGWLAGRALVRAGAASRGVLAGAVLAGVMVQVPLVLLALGAGRTFGATGDGTRHERPESSAVADA